jgi:phenylpropionate dioxygenase-like ring-hydroxylating dioxygenase large terminal subunit
VLIVRGDDGVLRAFQNACRHRGNSLCVGSGSGLRELRCGYHGWTWDLAGTLKRVPNRRGFGALRLSDFPLVPARVDTWEGLVFVNLDVDAIPLIEYLEAVPDDISWCHLGDFGCYATLTVDVEANWKTIADGYSETYHIQTLHPELLRCVDDIHAPQQIWGHTGKSDQPYGVQSPRFEGALSDEEVWDAYVYTQGALMGAAEGTPFPADEREPGQTVQDLIAARARAFAASRGVDLGWADTDRIMRLHQYNVFPNMTLLANADHLTIMCSRPGPDPDRGEFVMFLMTRMAPRRGAHQADGRPDERRGGRTRPGAHPGHPGAPGHTARHGPTRLQPLGALRGGAARGQHASQPRALPRPTRIRADQRRWRPECLSEIRGRRDWRGACETAPGRIRICVWRSPPSRAETNGGDYRIG